VEEEAAALASESEKVKLAKHGIFINKEARPSLSLSLSLSLALSLSLSLFSLSSLSLSLLSLSPPSLCFLQLLSYDRLNASNILHSKRGRKQHDTKRCAGQPQPRKQKEKKNGQKNKKNRKKNNTNWRLRGAC
jgi:hypothetical protein